MRELNNIDETFDDPIEVEIEGRQAKLLRITEDTEIGTELELACTAEVVEIDHFVGDDGLPQVTATLALRLARKPERQSTKPAEVQPQGRRFYDNSNMD